MDATSHPDAGPRLPETSTPGGDAALHEEALAVLRRLVDRPDARFKDGQFEAIEALVAHRRRALVVQRTGWGKSAVYFVASLLLRARGAGPTLIVSPLLALMRDQVAAAARAGVRAVSVSSANATEWDEVRARLAADEVDVLLISPERLTNPRFRDEQLPDLVARMGLLVVDEAHCISDWGHDFRPDYRRIRDLIGLLPAEGPRAVPVLATTATANARVVADVVEQLGVASEQDVFVLRGPLARASLRLGVLRMPSPAARLAWLLDHLGDLPGSGIVYALTVSAAEDTARALREAGHEVVAYTGRTDPERRAEIEEDLKANRVKAVVATSALGMGFDKPDLTFVVHLGAPGSPVAYYQQVGRAGRGTDHADVLLLPGPEDRRIWEYFATASMPDEEQARAVLGALADHGGALSVAALEPAVRIKRTPWSCCSRSSPWTGRSSGWAAAGAPPGGSGRTTPSGTPVWPRPAGPRSGSCSTTRPRTGAAWSSWPAPWTTPPPRRAAAATSAPAPGTRRDRTGRRVSARRPPCAAPVCRSSPVACGPRAWTGWACPSRGASRPSRRPRRAARSPA